LNCPLEIMKGLFVCATLACLLIAANADLILTTCARMNDGVIGRKVADTACMMSCNTKNCGGSKCVFREGRAVCTCDRCANGAGNYPPFG
ncbi:hypothetical protein PMAYCL1PPCAC_21086, partial [Pristionchus mayeri]